MGGRHTRNVKHGSSRVSPRGPVFLSYRHSDGAELATNLAWALRSAGVPVWHDKSDLPPGDTERRLEEAMQSGLSGAVLLVTPEIGSSNVVKDIELPQLLALEAEGAFTLSIASTIDKEAGGLDYGAPDRLLSQPDPTLQRLRQDPALTPKNIADIARSHCRQRMEALRGNIESVGQFIDINLQTRITPSASGLYGDLVVRLRPPMAGDRRPHRQGLEDLQLFLGDLPHLLEIASAEACEGQWRSAPVCCIRSWGRAANTAPWGCGGSRHRWAYVEILRQRSGSSSGRTTAGGHRLLAKWTELR